MLKLSRWRAVLPARLHLPENAITLLLLLLPLVIAVLAVEEVRWVERMPPLAAVVTLGAGLALLLARSPAPAFLLQVVGLEASVLLGMAATLLVAEGATPRDRVTDLALRLAQWWEVARFGGTSSDPLPFTLAAAMLTALGAYLSAWYVFRRHSGRFALGAGGTVLMVHLTWFPDRAVPYFVAFMLTALLLTGWLAGARRARQLREDGGAAPPSTIPAFLGGGMLIAIVALLPAFALPLPGPSGWAHQLVQQAGSLWPSLAAEAGRLFAAARPVYAAQFPFSAQPTLSQVIEFGPRLQVQGAVDLGRAAVMTVTADSPSYWRAGAYDGYTGQGWVKNVRTVRPQQNQGPGAAALFREREEVSIGVELHQTANTLVSAGIPGATGPGALHEVTGRVASTIDSLGLRPLRPLPKGQTYATVSTVSTASDDQLRAAGTRYPAWVTDRYLQLPADLPESVRLLAAGWAEGHATPYDRAVAVERNLRTLFTYSLDVPAAPPDRDVVEHFLFELKRGYCTHYATAMAVMLRSQNVPARVAVGFVSGQQDPATGRYIVSEEHAHAWVEVYFPSYGWVEFDPTPAWPSSRFPAPAAAAPDEPAAEDPGTVEPDQAPAPEAPASPETPAGVDPASGVEPASLPSIPTWPVAALAGAVLLALLGRAAWSLSLVGLDPVARSYEKAVRLGALRGARLRDSETPAEFAARLAAVFPSAAAAIIDLAAAYARHRFGGHPVRPADARRADDRWRRIRAALLRYDRRR